MPTGGTSPLREQSTAQVSLCDEDTLYSFVADCYARAERIGQRLAVVDLRCAEYLRERQAVLEAVSPGILVGVGTHGPSNPTLDKQQKLDALRREYRDDLRRYRIVSRILRWLHNPFKESEIMRGRSGADSVPKGVPAECEGHYRLFLAMVESAVNDVLRGAPGSPRFESALTWLTEGWGFETMNEISRGAAKMKEHFLLIANQRRESLTPPDEKTRLDAGRTISEKPLA